MHAKADSPSGKARRKRQVGLIDDPERAGVAGWAGRTHVVPFVNVKVRAVGPSPVSIVILSSSHLVLPPGAGTTRTTRLVMDPTSDSWGGQLPGRHVKLSAQSVRQKGRKGGLASLQELYNCKQTGGLRQQQRGARALETFCE